MEAVRALPGRRLQPITYVSQAVVVIVLGGGGVETRAWSIAVEHPTPYQASHSRSCPPPITCGLPASHHVRQCGWRRRCRSSPGTLSPTGRRRACSIWPSPSSSSASTSPPPSSASYRCVDKQFGGSVSLETQTSSVTFQGLKRSVKTQGLTPSSSLRGAGASPLPGALCAYVWLVGVPVVSAAVPLPRHDELQDPLPRAQRRQGEGERKG